MKFTQSGGPTWPVEVGRRDGTVASSSLATTNLPSPTSGVAALLQNFENVGLSAKDMVALSGAHTIGKARCSTFASRLTGAGDSLFLHSLRQLCSGSSNGTTEASSSVHLDVGTPAVFDNQYYANLFAGEGLLPSDQALAGEAGEVGALAKVYAADEALFFEDFAASMVTMGRLAAPAGSPGEVRKSCRAVNS